MPPALGGPVDTCVRRRERRSVGRDGQKLTTSESNARFQAFWPGQGGCLWFSAGSFERASSDSNYQLSAKSFTVLSSSQVPDDLIRDLQKVEPQVFATGQEFLAYYKRR